MSNDFKELLLQDYRYRSEAMWRNEEGGEKRVHLFIALIAAAGSVTGALISKGADLVSGTGRLFAIAALASLLIVGLVTLMRMMTRNENTDLAKRQMDAIRETFKDHFDDAGALDHYNLFPPGGVHHDPIKARKLGGLAHTIAFMNGLLCAGLVFAILSPYISDFYGQVVEVLLVFGVTAGAQIVYVGRKEDRWREELRRTFPRLTHAGGIVYAAQNGGVKYLLVGPSSPSRNRVEWLLPKGHIDPGESAREAALREVLEETGVVARPIGMVGRIQFATWEKREDIQASFYLMEKCGRIPAKEKDRAVIWLPFEEALEMLSYPESKMLLHKAELVRLRSAGEPATA
jgi:8-oxo-dGTP pyrophosphatase MutT (NUDIX family)